MKRDALIFMMLASAPTRAEDQTNHHILATPPDAQIVVTVNPEARVSAVLNSPVSESVHCGSAIKINVKVLNQAFVTAHLRAGVVSDGLSKVGLGIEDKKLSGKSQDDYVLHLTLPFSEAAELTIIFSIEGNIGDHAGRDRVHVFVPCR